jgi:phospholipase/carboxylesterase
VSEPLERFPHRYEPGAPGDVTLLALHGTGGDEHDLLPLARAIRPGSSVLSPRGRVLEHGMPRFFRRLAEGVFDQEDLRFRTTELAEFVHRAATQYRFDPRRIVAVGFSNGANIAASLLLRYPGVLRAAILFRAMLPFVPDHPVRLEDTSVLLSSGRRDPIAPPPQAESLAAVLREAGADVTIQWDDGDHGLVPDSVSMAREWLEQRIPESSARPA